MNFRYIGTVITLKFFYEILNLSSYSCKRGVFCSTFLSEKIDGLHNAVAMEKIGPKVNYKISKIIYGYTRCKNVFCTKISIKLIFAQLMFNAIIDIECVVFFFVLRLN